MAAQQSDGNVPMQDPSVATATPLATTAGQTKTLDDNFYYPSNSFAPEPDENEMARGSLNLFYSFGFQSSKRSNLHYLTDSTIVTAMGNVLVLINLRTLEQDFVVGTRCGSIGAIAVHPSLQFIAVAEKSQSVPPNIYIYSYPALKLYRVLREGTERGYSDLSFNADGSKLASVGGDPDYMLTLWDWKQERILLRSKAFSQDVHNITFSLEDGGQLVTSGIGHIKFWKMSSTFTGLKLKGQLGKFGASELTDIAAFVQLPDGKVLSSTETGNLLLWDGGLIKCEIAVKGKKPCHQGRIEVCLLEEGEILTAGEDGYVRVWDSETVDNADVVSAAGPVPAADVPAPVPASGGAATGGAGTLVAAGPRIFEIEPLDEIHVGKDVKIQSMVKVLGSQTEYLIQDSLGHIWKLDIKKRAPEKIMSFHAGAVTGMDTSPLGHTMVSLGVDGTVRVYDYVTKALVGKVKYAGSGTSLAYLPMSLDPTGTTIATGYSDGVLRLIQHSFHFIGSTNLTFKLTHVLKPHNQPITCLSFSPEGQYIATASSDHTIFFCQVDTEGKEGDVANGGDTGEEPLEPEGAGDEQPPRFSSKAVITPIGFVQLQSPVTSISWLPTSELEDEEGQGDDPQGQNQEGSIRQKVMVTLKDGSVQIFEIPMTSEVSNDVSFELDREQVNAETWRMDWTAVRKAEAVARKAAAEKAKQEQKDQPDQQDGAIAATSAGDEGGSKDGANGEEEVELDEGPVGGGYRATGVWCIDSNEPVNRNLFLLALESADGSGEVRMCSLEKPTVSRIVITYKSPLTTLRISHSGKYFICGARDGTNLLRVFRLQDFDLEQAVTHETCPKSDGSTSLVQRPTGSAGSSSREPLPNQKWHGHVHEDDRGWPTAVNTTFDDAFLCTAGNDGGLFVFRVTMEDIKKSQAISDIGYEDDAAANEETEVLDISDPSAYSIQDAKLKLEKDKEIEDAELKKQSTKNTIQELRKEFLSLLAENTKSPPEQQIPRSAMNVDPGLHEDIAKETSERLKIARKELEWISEKESVGPNKLRKKFLDDIQTERIEIKAFKSPRIVATFRTTKQTESIDAILSSVCQSKENIAKDTRIKDILDPQSAQRHATDESVTEKDRGPGKAAKQLDSKGKHEARKQLRAERAALWKHLLDAKPDEHYEDPKDVAAIRYAETHMGDFKLKTGSNYIVPESERVDADKKNRQLMLLRESLLALKEQFNANILQLRDKKRRLIDHIQSSVHQIDEINQELGLENESAESLPWSASMQMETSAYPENRYKVDAADIASLQREQAEAVKRARDDGGGMNVTGGFGGSEKEDGASKVSNASLPAQAAAVSNQSSAAVSAGNDPSAGVSESANGARTDLSPLELHELDTRRRTLQYRKTRIIKNVEMEVNAFDSTLDALSHERLLLEADVKYAEMKLLLLYKEWVLLKEFEKYDNSLADKLASKRAEKGEIDFKINDCQEKLSAKKTEVEQVIAREKEIQEEFRKALGDDNKYEDLLTKIYKRKIKRTKKKIKVEKTAEGTDGADGDEASDVSEESEEESEYDSDDSLGSETGSESGFDETCPADGDPDTFAKVLELRERRMDEEDVLNEIQKTIEGLKKDNDALIKKEKVIDAALKNAEAEIQAFQTQKQKKLNELDVVIPLRLHQLQYLENNALPSDLSPALVFVNRGLWRLKERIRELQQEKNDIRKQHKELKKMHVSLVKSRKEKQSKLAELEARAHDVQMLKFGQIIDLDKLERMGVNKNADELREKLQREDNRRAKEVEQWDAKIARLRESLTHIISENTSRLESLISFSEQKRKLEAALNYSQSSVTAEYNGLQKKDIQEREELVQFVRVQAQEIDQLKEEIQVLIT